MPKMSAAVVLAETAAFQEATVPLLSSDERLRDLVHELRQPLSSIEAIAYYLEMTLPAGQVQARQLMTHVQRLVEDANAILESSAGIARKPCGRAKSAGAA
jgi:phosphoglycerate-specific signal transduction histidine kinase